MEDNQKKQVTTNKVGYAVGGVVLFLIIIFSLSYFLNNNNTANSTKTASSNSNKTLRQITLAEIANHGTRQSCWTTINGGVYDVSKFIPQHNGGDRILAACGKDATDLFTGKSPMGRVHSQLAVKLLSSMQIGTLQK